ncbi:hypothetical protein FPQ18DRAFT_414108 [Pyronema domesticum]|nr:hypothetical protein FPQ18DRAFT_414108 [Pyronema domesticum]
MKWDFSRSPPTLLLLGSIAVGNAKEIEVKAGYDHVFTPDSIVADVGDTIRPHSVVRGDWGSPCIDYSRIYNKDAFYSGIITTINYPQPGNFQTWTLTVNDTEPKHGMVGVINSDAKNLSDYKAGALKANFQLSPGDPWPAEGSGTTPNPIDSNGKVVTIIQPSTPADNSVKLSVGGIAGIVVGTVAIVAILGALFFFLGRSKTKQEPVPAIPATPSTPGPQTMDMPPPMYPMSQSPPPQFAPGMDANPYGYHGYQQAYTPVDNRASTVSAMGFNDNKSYAPGWRESQQPEMMQQHAAELGGDTIMSQRSKSPEPPQSPHGRAEV